MAITVVDNQATAGVSFVKIRAGVVVVDPVTSVTYVAPVVGVSYIDISLSAALDTTGRFMFVPDVAVMVDGARFSLAKLLADAALPQDATRYELEKAVPGDSVAILESFAKTFTYIRGAADTLSLADTRILAVDKALGEAPVVLDADTFALAKRLSDGVAMNDALDAGDGAVFSFAKGVSNVTIVGDATSKQIGKARADTAAVVDAGVLTMQDYCDITYFAEDYVGESRVF